MKLFKNGIKMTFSAMTLVMAIGVSSLSMAAPVNVNTADAQTIADSLKGIGLSKAQAIVSWRENNGNFNDLASLRQVKGIGEKTLEKNKQDIQF